MKRDFKFRAWCGNDFVYFDLYNDSDTDFHQFCSIIDQLESPIEAYTSLKDKNGKEIYEGDILDDGEGHIGKVLYNERIASFAYEWGNCGATFMSLYTSDMKVIGNIHENPELLEKEE